MDNAAKALLLAGGILIGILIISLSMYMYTQFQDVYSDNMRLKDSYEKTSFNSFFTKYGEDISGADAYNILSRVYESNNDYDDIAEVIDVNGDAGFSVDSSDTNYYEKVFYFSEFFHETYKYSYTYGNDGVISTITIDKT